MNPKIRAAIVEAFGEIDKTLHTATILHAGWEDDNLGWVIRFKDGTVRGVSTRQGRPCPWSVDAMEMSALEASASAQSLRVAAQLMSEMAESRHLLDSPANAEHLAKSIAQACQGDTA